VSIADLMKVLGEGSDVIVRPKGRGFQVKTLSDERELRKARRRAWLAQADALREQIAARVGGPLPDSVNELRELREERTDELAVDASILIKLLIREEFTDQARSLWNLWTESEIEIIAPALFLFEVTATLRKKVHRGLIKLQEGEAAFLSGISQPKPGFRPHFAPQTILGTRYRPASRCGS